MLNNLLMRCDNLQITETRVSLNELQILVFALFSLDICVTASNGIRPYGELLVGIGQGKVAPLHAGHIVGAI
jgi:poly(3-hydroxyalkanoate) synthetase